MRTVFWGVSISTAYRIVVGHILAIDHDHHSEIVEHVTHHGHHAAEDGEHNEDVIHKSRNNYGKVYNRFTGAQSVKEYNDEDITSEEHNYGHGSRSNQGYSRGLNRRDAIVQGLKIHHEEEHTNDAESLHDDPYHSGGRAPRASRADYMHGITGSGSDTTVRDSSHSKEGSQGRWMSNQRSEFAHNGDPSSFTGKSRSSEVSHIPSSSGIDMTDVAVTNEKINTEDATKGSEKVLLTDGDAAEEKARLDSHSTEKQSNSDDSSVSVSGGTFATKSNMALDSSSSLTAGEAANNSLIDADREDDAEITQSILYRQSKFVDNLSEYYRRIQLIGITAASAAIHVQVLASLAELSLLALSHIETIEASRKQADWMIQVTLKRLTEVVTMEPEATYSNNVTSHSEESREPKLASAKDESRILIQNVDSSSSSRSSSGRSSSLGSSGTRSSSSRLSREPVERLRSGTKTTKVIKKTKTTMKLSLDMDALKKLAADAHEALSTHEDSSAHQSSHDTSSSSAQHNNFVQHHSAQSSYTQPVYYTAATVHPCSVCAHNQPHQAAYAYGYSSR